MTLRALDSLQNCDAIVCEDSRHSSLLLNHYKINKPLLVLNDFNESAHVGTIIQKLEVGQNLCLISDAGTPLISDPGYKLVRECLEKNIKVDCLPGPSSVITSLTMSKLPPDKFMFIGYLPDKPGHRDEMYRKLQEISNIMPVTFIIFIAPFKLQKTFEEIRDNLGDIHITLAKELTKIHQNVEEKPISSWVQAFKSQHPKGEYIALFRLS